MKRLFNWWKRRKLRIARERYSAYKAKAAAIKELSAWSLSDEEEYIKTCSKIGKYEERIETLMRE